MRLSTGLVGVSTVLSLHDGSPALRVTLEVDNQASDHRLRLRFPTGLPGGSAVAGSAFGVTDRPVVRYDPDRYPRETPVATAPAQRFVAHAGHRRGLAIFAPGFFEHELSEEGDLLVTVLRAVGELSRSDLATRPGHAGWPTATPEAQCRGVERMQFAVCPVRSPAVDDGTTLPTIWEDLFLPPRAVWLRQAPPLQMAPIECTLGGEGIVFSALKPAERGQGVVLRCYNARPTPVTGTCRVPIPLASAARTRADEQGPVDLPVESDRRTVRFRAEGHEIVTLLLHPALPSADGKD
jgi:alpha-mannosidase